MTAKEEADCIILGAEEAAKRCGAKFIDDRLAYHVGVLQGHIRQLCHEAHDTREELKKVQKELLWERKNG